MAGRLNRFLNLEGARPAVPEDPNGKPSPRASSGRFDPAPAPAAAIDPAAGDPAASEAFEQLQAVRRAQLQSGLALDEHSDEEQPFVRCGQCETDSARGTVRCKTCGAELQTPMQQAFNQELWKARKLELAKEREELAARAKDAAEESPLSPAEQQRLLGESLAREVASRESTRLSWMDPGGAPATSGRPIGMRLLDKIPSPGVRFAIALGLLGLACFLGWKTFTSPRGEQNPLVEFGFFALLLLFIPMGRRRNIFNRW